MAIGVFIIVQEGLAGGHFLGDLSALCAAMSIARAIGLSGVVWGSVLSQLVFVLLPTWIYIRRMFKRGSFAMTSPGYGIMGGFHKVLEKEWIPRGPLGGGMSAAARCVESSIAGKLKVK